jgi:hypothetical protein
MKTVTSILLVGLCISCLAAPAAEAVQGREYVKRERQIYKMAKAMESEQDEVKVFGGLLEDLDDCDIGESTREFWRTAREVKAAMERELAEMRARVPREAAAERTEQVKKAVQEAEMLETAPMDTSDQSAEKTPLEQRLRRMEMIYREAEGLRNPMGMADLSVVKRYRLLAGEFHDLMKEDIEATEAEIERLKELNRRAR